MAHDRVRRCLRRDRGGASELREQIVEVERKRGHLQHAVLLRPLAARPIVVELDAVAVRVGEVERLADQMVGGAVEAGAGLGEADERLSELPGGRGSRIARWNNPLARRSSG